jgi:branched-chain amino acid transport system substrate-binding protein
LSAFSARLNRKEVSRMNTNRLAHVFILALGGLALTLALLMIPAAGSPARANPLPVSLPPTDKPARNFGIGSVITLGVAVDLTGGDAIVGWQEANSVQLAVSQTNASGGVNIGGITYALALVTADSPCGNNPQAIAAANALLAAGAKAVVGHDCSGTTFAAQPIYNAGGVAMISPSASDPGLTQQGYTTTFRTVSLDGAPVILLATTFRHTLGLASSAIVETPDGFSHNMGGIYSDTFAALGGTITSRRVATNTSDFPAVLTAMQTEHPEAIIYLGADAATAGQFSLAAAGLGMTSTVAGWNSSSFDESVLATYATNAGVAAENDYAAMQYRRFQDMPGWAAFLAAYQAAHFANQPSDPSVYGAFAYDAAKIILAAMAGAGSPTPAAIRDQIAAAHNYVGVVGTYEGFDAHGEVIPQWAWLERYHAGQWVVLNPMDLYLPLVRRN